MRLIRIVALCLLPHVATAQSPGPPPVRVVGPLPVTADSYPFGAADHTRVPEDLKKVGYVEEEHGALRPPIDLWDTTASNNATDLSDTTR
jgi:hypothetical protein